MTAQGVDYLVKMANDIARNLAAVGDEAAVALKVADHINRFWSPDMRCQLVEHAEAGGEELLPVVKLAVGGIKV